MTYKHKTLAVVIASVLAGCNAEDNTTIGNGGSNTYAPTADPVKTPALYVGDIVEGIYHFTDANIPPRAEGKTEFSWKLEGTPIAATRTLEVKSDYLGKNMEFCVTPVSEGAVNTRGKEDCSEPTPVLDSLGTKPTVENVEFSSSEAPVVGTEYDIEWTYEHAEGIEEGKSIVSWYHGEELLEETVKNEGSSSSTIVFDAVDGDKILEGKSFTACVQAHTDSDPVLSSIVDADKHCIETLPLQAKVGSAPEASNTPTIEGQPFVGATLSIADNYLDVDGDKAATHEYKWFSGETEVATTSTYQPVEADKGNFIRAEIKLCAETGSPKCSAEFIKVTPMDTPIGVSSEEAPTASNLNFTITSSDEYPVVGATLRGVFKFEHPSAAEGESTSAWKIVGETDNLVTCDTNAHNCDVTIKAEHLGKELDFCAIPVTEMGKPADKAYCLSDSDNAVTPAGVVITGSMEYGKTLTANAVGFGNLTAEGGYWTMDTSIPTDSISNANQIKVGDGSTYRIGVQHLASDMHVNLVYEDPKGKSDAIHNIEPDGIVTDNDWIAGSHDKSQDSRNFIGKEVFFCLEEGNCFEVSKSDAVGGLYYDQTNAEVRGVEPVRFVEMTASKFHRPLTVAETIHKGALGVTADYPEAVHSININGVDWALSKFSEKNVVAACRNLSTDTQWFVPVAYKGDNNLAGNEDMPASIEADLIQHVADKRVSTHNSAINSLMSPYYGWVVGNSIADDGTKIQYASASTKNTNNENYATRMYGRGLSYDGKQFNNAVNAKNVDDLPIFISCQSVR